MPDQELRRRGKVLRMAMERMLPEFVRSCIETGDPFLIHQDAFGADYDEDELLGMAITFAGPYGKELHFERGDSKQEEYKFVLFQQ